MGTIVVGSNERARRRIPTGGRPPGLALSIQALSPGGYWKLDESSGTTAADSSGNGRNGTYTNTYTLANKAGEDGVNYASFNNGYVLISDNSAFSATNGITIVALIRPETSELAAATARNFVCKGQGSNYEWNFAICEGVAGRLRHTFWSPAGGSFANEYVDGLLSANTWHLVAARSAAPVYLQRYSLFVDSAAPVTSTQGATGNVSYADVLAPVTIGVRGDNPAGTHWVGGLAHVAIFPTALSDANLASIRQGALNDGWTV